MLVASTFFGSSDRQAELKVEELEHDAALQLVLAERPSSGGSSSFGDVGGVIESLSFTGAVCRAGSTSSLSRRGAAGELAGRVEARAAVGVSSSLLLVATGEGIRGRG